MAQFIQAQSTAPATPAAGYDTMYFKTDKQLYYKDDAGVEHAVVDLGNLLKNVEESDNPLINGAHKVAQEATSGTLTAGGSTSATTYTTDMHHAWCTGANVNWAQFAVNQLGFDSAIQFTGAASVTAIGHGIRVESKNCYHFANGNVVVPVRMYNSLLTSVAWTAYYVNAVDTFGTNGSGAKTQIATGTLTLTAADTTLREYDITFAAGANIGNGFVMEFTVGAQTSGTWVITGEDAVAGTVSRPYPHMTYDRVLAQCQRYLFVLDSSSGAGDRYSGVASSATNSIVFVPLRVQSRIPFSGITLSPNTPGNLSIFNAASGTGAATAVALGSTGINTATLSVTTTAGTPTISAGSFVEAYPTNTSLKIIFTGAQL